MKFCLISVRYILHADGRRLCFPLNDSTQTYHSTQTESLSWCSVLSLHSLCFWCHCRAPSNWILIFLIRWWVDDDGANFFLIFFCMLWKMIFINNLRFSYIFFRLFCKMKCFSYIRFFSSFLSPSPRTLRLLLLMLMGAAGKYTELKKNAKRKITMQNQYYNLIRSHFLHWNLSISSPILAPFTLLMLSICLELFPLRFCYFPQHYIRFFFSGCLELKNSTYEKLLCIIANIN